MRMNGAPKVILWVGTRRKERTLLWMLTTHQSTQQMTAFCTNCGAALRSTPGFCPSCGARIAEATGLPAGFIGRPSTQAHPASPEEVKRLHKCRGSLVQGIVVLLCSPFTFLYLGLWGLVPLIGGGAGIIMALNEFAQAHSGTVKYA